MTFGTKYDALPKIINLKIKDKKLSVKKKVKLWISFAI